MSPVADTLTAVFRQPAVGGGPSATPSRAARLAFWAFVAVEAATFALWLWRGHTAWFRFDEWEFLVDRSATSPYDLIDDHNAHWSTVPILVFRGLWLLVGLRSYIPYLVIVIALHLACAALLRAVMRRAGVDPWIATAAAAVFALFGTGYANIVWAFQIGFSGALALGLTHLLLADHDGPVDKRDWLGLAAGLGALMSSGVGVAMVAVVGIAVFVRRGWRIALLHAGSLGVVYLTWWLAIGREGYQEGPAHGDPEIGDMARFVWTGISHSFGALGQITGLGLILGALFAIGLVLAWSSLDLATFRRRAAAPAALALGAGIFLLETGYSRVGFFGPDFARESRYTHVIAALLLPALAVALDAFVRRWRPLLPLACIVLLLGVPGNVDTLSDWTSAREDYQRQYRHLMLSIPRTEAGREVPGAVRPDTSHPDAANITVGWLREAARSGRLPEPGAITTVDEEAIRFRLSLLQSDASDAPSSGCPRLTKPVTRHLEEGDTFTFDDATLLITPPKGDIPRAVQLSVPPTVGERLTAVNPVDVVLQPANLYLIPRICPIERAT